MGLMSYIKKRKRTTVLAILLFIPFKGLVFATFFSSGWRFSEAFLYALELDDAFAWTDEVNLFSRNSNARIYGGSDGWYLDMYTADNDMGLALILAIILFPMIIYVFNDKIKAR